MHENAQLKEAGPIAVTRGEATRAPERCPASSAWLDGAEPIYFVSSVATPAASFAASS